MNDEVHHHRHHHSHRKLTAFGSLQPRPLLVSGLISVLTAVILYVLCNQWLGIGMLIGQHVRWFFVLASLLSGYGIGVLLWSVVGIPHTDDGKRSWDKCSAVIAVVLYHLAAAIGYFLMFPRFMYVFTLGLWTIKTLLCFFIITDFLFVPDSALRKLGVLLFLVCTLWCPFLLPDLWGAIQWFAAKIAFIALAIELFRYSWRMYKPHKKRI